MAGHTALSVEQLPRLMEKLKPSLLDALPIFYTADNVLRGRLTLEDVQFYVDTWPSPTWVALVSPAHTGQLHNYRTTVDLWCKESGAVVSFFRHNNNILDFSQPVFFRVQHITDGELKEVCSLLEQKKGVCNSVERHIYVCDDSSPLERLKPPEGYTLLDKLSPSNAETVGHEYTAWGIKPSQAVHYFQTCSTHLPSSGAVGTQDGQLVSYAALHHTSALGSVRTDPQHQRLGLGRVVVTDVCGKIRADGQTPYVYVNPDNAASAGLYSKCGFECRAKAFRIRYAPEK